MGSVIENTLGTFVLIIGANLGAAAIGWKIYPTRHAMIKKYLIVVGAITVLIGSVLVIMMVQFAQSGL